MHFSMHVPPNNSTAMHVRGSGLLWASLYNQSPRKTKMHKRPHSDLYSAAQTSNTWLLLSTEGIFYCRKRIIFKMSNKVSINGKTLLWQKMYFYFCLIILPACSIFAPLAYLRATRPEGGVSQTHIHTVVNCHVGTENRITTEPSLQIPPGTFYTNNK